MTENDFGVWYMKYLKTLQIRWRRWINRESQLIWDGIDILLILALHIDRAWTPIRYKMLAYCTNDAIGLHAGEMLDIMIMILTSITPVCYWFKSQMGSIYVSCVLFFFAFGCVFVFVANMYTISSHYSTCGIVPLPNFLHRGQEGRLGSGKARERWIRMEKREYSLMLLPRPWEWWCPWWWVFSLRNSLVGNYFRSETQRERRWNHWSDERKYKRESGDPYDSSRFSV